MAASDSAQINTFLIADIRGYTRLTQEYGDETAARVATRFAELVQEGATARGGRLVEMRGDEALAVFASTRAAIRASVDLQIRFSEMNEDEVPLPVGIGIDVGEAVPVGEGYRGAALNVAARLCSLAAPGEILVTAEVAHLAGAMDGITLQRRGQQRLKGLSEPVTVLNVQAEGLPARQIAVRSQTLPPARSEPQPVKTRSDEMSERIRLQVESAVGRSLEHGFQLAERQMGAHPAAKHEQVSAAPRQLFVALLAAGVGFVILIMLAATIWIILHIFGVL